MRRSSGSSPPGCSNAKRENQRVVVLRPTKQGREALRAATRRVRRAERAAFAGLSERDEATVRGWLARLAAITAHVDAEEKQ